MTRRKKAADALCQLRSQQCPTVGAGVPDGPAAHGNGLIPPAANPHMPGRERRPRRSTQQHRTEATRQANPHSPCRARRTFPFVQSALSHSPPAGEGVAHKGDRRGRTRRNRDVKMTETGGICERFYRLQAVTFSLFRHPPRGGSADATFPRWGKEKAAADSPDVGACLWRCCWGVGTPPPTIKCCGFARRLSHGKNLLLSTRTVPIDKQTNRRPPSPNTLETGVCGPYVPSLTGRALRPRSGWCSSCR